MADVQDYVQKFIDIGATPIPDDEIVDHGTHFEWVAFHPRHQVWCVDPQEGYHDMERYADYSSVRGEFLRDARRLRFYPLATYEKPLRVSGMFRYGSTLLEFRPTAAGTNRYKINLDWPSPRTTSAMTYVIQQADPGDTFTRITYADLTEEQRYAYLYGKALALRTTRGHHQSILDGLFAHPQRGYAYRGAGLSFTDCSWGSMRGACEGVGALIGQEDPDLDDFKEAITTLGAYLPTDRAVEAWNRRHPDHALRKCTCGHWETEDDAHELRRGRTACNDCFHDSDVVVYLEDTGGHDMRDYAYYHEDDDEWRSYPVSDYDDDDDENHEHGAVRGYSSNVLDYLRADPKIKPSPYGDFLMGVELEVVPKNGMSNHGVCVEDTQVELCPEYAILKHDGSLDDGGFEIVTAPRGLAEHVRRFSEWTPHSKLRAWDAGCCGMHVHISSAAFTAVTLGKFIEFINSEANDDLIKSIAGRHPKDDDQAQSYAQRDGITTGNPKKTCADKSTSRYHMVNTSNMHSDECERLGVTFDGDSKQNTVEIRIFRASLKKERMLAQLEFAHAAVMFTRWSSMRELRREHFIIWLQGMAGVYPNLAKWFGVKANTLKVDPTPKAVHATADV